MKTFKAHSTNVSLMLHCHWYTATDINKAYSRNRDDGDDELQNAIFSNKIRRTATITRDEKYLSNSYASRRPGFKNTIVTNRKYSLRSCEYRSILTLMVAGSDR